MRAPLAAFALLLLAARGQADGLGAQALGMGGAGAALDSPSEALYHNVAGLSSSSGFEAAMLSGYGGSLKEASHALAFSLPLQAGVAALALEDSRLGRLGDFRDQKASLAFALPVSEWLWMGARQQAFIGQPGDFRGWATDIGLQWNLAGSLWGGRFLELGLSARNLLSQASWSGGAAESLPFGVSASASFRPASPLRFAFQADLSDRSDLGRANVWRAGMEGLLWKERAALRLGYFGGDAQPAHATAGAGGRFEFGGQEWKLDYAAMFPTAGLGAVLEPRHLVTLSLAFRNRKESAGPPKARLAGLKMDREGGLEQATLLLDSQAEPDSKAWEMTLRDDKGRVLRTFRGKGVLPSKLEWDGTDEDGRPVRSSGFSYALKVVRPDGREMTRRSLLYGEESATEEVEGLAVSRGRSSYGLRDLDDEGPSPLARVRPVLKKDSDTEVGGAAFDLGHLTARNVKKWQLKVVDEEGRTVRTFSGEGRPPKDLAWEGDADPGRPSPRASKAGYVLRFTDEGGRENTETGDLDRVEPSPRLPQAGEAGDGLKSLAKRLSKCKLKPDLSACRCTFHFAHGSSVIVLDELFTFWALVKFAKMGGLTDLRIHGFTDNAGSQASNQRLSEIRAEAIYKWVKALGLKPGQADLAGFGEALPVSENRSAEGRSRNRRVEVEMKAPFQ